MSASAKPPKGEGSYRIKIAEEALYLTLDDNNKVIIQTLQESNRQKVSVQADPSHLH